MERIYHCVHGTSCLCTLSASALMFFQPSLHQLDFFKKSFYRDLYVHVCISVYKYVAKNCLFEVLMTKNLLLV